MASASRSAPRQALQRQRQLVVAIAAGGRRAAPPAPPGAPDRGTARWRRRCRRRYGSGARPAAGRWARPAREGSIPAARAAASAGSGVVATASTSSMRRADASSRSRRASKAASRLRGAAARPGAWASSWMNSGWPPESSAMAATAASLRPRPRTSSAASWRASRAGQVAQRDPLGAGRQRQRVGCHPGGGGDQQRLGRRARAGSPPAAPGCRRRPSADRRWPAPPAAGGPAGPAAPGWRRTAGCAARGARRRWRAPTPAPRPAGPGTPVPAASRRAEPASRASAPGSWARCSETASMMPSNALNGTASRSKQRPRRISGGERLFPQRLDEPGQQRALAHARLALDQRHRRCASLSPRPASVQQLLELEPCARRRRPAAPRQLGQGHGRPAGRQSRRPAVGPPDPGATARRTADRDPRGNPGTRLLGAGGAGQLVPHHIGEAALIRAADRPARRTTSRPGCTSRRRR